MDFILREFAAGPGEGRISYELKEGEEVDFFSVNMARHNSFHSLLPPELVSGGGGRPSFFWESGAYQSLDELCRQEWTADLFHSLLGGIDLALGECRAYLLDPAVLPFRPETVFYGDRGQWLFLLLPALPYFPPSPEKEKGEEGQAGSSTTDDRLRALIKFALMSPSYRDGGGEPYLGRWLRWVHSGEGWPGEEGVEGDLKKRETEAVPLPSGDSLAGGLAIEESQLEGEGAFLLDLKSGRQVALDRAPFLIGHDLPSVDLFLNNPCISRQHACLFKEGGGWFIQDLGSTNASYLNDSRLEPLKSYPLKKEDTILLADQPFRFMG